MSAQKQPNDREVWVENPEFDKATHRFFPKSSKTLQVGPPPKSVNDREIWDKLVEEAKKEPRAELTDDRPKIRAALRSSRMGHTVRIKSHLP